jgi:hypothetical protein
VRSRFYFRLRVAVAGMVYSDLFIHLLLLLLFVVISSSYLLSLLLFNGPVITSILHTAILFLLLHL